MKLIIILVIAAACGITVVLGTWLYGSYQQRMDLLTASAEQCLFEAVQEVAQELDARAPDSLKRKLYMPWKKHLLERWKTEIPEIPVDRMEKLLDDVMLAERQQHVKRMEMLQGHDKNRTERLPKNRFVHINGHGGEPPRAKWLTMFGNMSRDLFNDSTISVIKDRFRANMLTRHLTMDFVFAIKEMPSFEFERQGAPFRPQLHFQAENGTLALRPFLVDPERGRFIHIYFDQPWQSLLYALSWQLVVSVFILAIVVGTFLYLFFTILEQNKLDTLRKAFINSLTHELRTPVTTVSVAIEALQSYIDPQDSAAREQYHAMAIEELDHLSVMIDRVLEIADSDHTDTKMLKMEPIDLKTVIHKSVAHLRLTQSHRGVTLSWEEPIQHFTVMGDAHHLKNLMNNLLDNAIKYGAMHIEISIYEDEKHVSIDVKDDGMGIPLAYQQQVFEPFFRVPNGDLYSVKGFGLGLPYVKRVVEQHRGRLKLKSKEGVGSIFIIIIPKYIA
ncbi:sensor histidine kinase [Sphingobacterium suaedae]|uniref:sensor histidine kinase n=1 Tax=Sphingobacterium suaedae TaxID=1686402 RepID=UPI003645441D